jgi:hypothetical protein
MTIRRAHPWLVGAAVAGTVAATLAAGLLWLVLTRPVAVAVLLARGLS